MTTYLIWFPGEEMDVADHEWQRVADDAHAVVRAARDAGVLVFTGGLDDAVSPVRIAHDGTVAQGPYTQTRAFSGGMAVIDVATRAEAEHWAARLAAACRCPQELRAFQVDPLL